MYRIGLSQTEMGEEEILQSGFSFRIVNPREQIVASVKAVLGKPYKRGASVSKDAPESFDCSSLVAWAAVEAGFAIPRISIDQFVFSKRIEKEELKPGDLVFANTKRIIHTEGSYFSQVLGKEVKEEAIRTETLEYIPGTKVPEGVDHVGVYVGGDKVVHASVSTGGVVEEDVNQSFSFENIVGYGRIVSDEGRRFVVEIPEDRKDIRNLSTLLQEIRK